MLLPLSCLPLSSPNSLFGDSGKSQITPEPLEEHCRGVDQESFPLSGVPGGDIWIDGVSGGVVASSETSGVGSGVSISKVESLLKFKKVGVDASSLENGVAERSSLSRDGETASVGTGETLRA